MKITDDPVTQIKILILDVLHQKKLEGRDEITVGELLEELGFDENTNIIGGDINDTIGLTDKALDNIEATKELVKRGDRPLH